MQLTTTTAAASFAVLFLLLAEATGLFVVALVAAFALGVRPVGRWRCAGSPPRARLRCFPRRPGLLVDFARRSLFYLCHHVHALKFKIYN